MYKKYKTQKEHGVLDILLQCMREAAHIIPDVAIKIMSRIVHGYVGQLSLSVLITILEKYAAEYRIWIQPAYGGCVQLKLCDDTLYLSKPDAMTLNGEGDVIMYRWTDGEHGPLHREEDKPAYWVSDTGSGSMEIYAKNGIICREAGPAARMGDISFWADNNIVKRIVSPEFDVTVDASVLVITCYPIGSIKSKHGYIPLSSFKKENFLILKRDDGSETCFYHMAKKIAFVMELSKEVIGRLRAYNEDHASLDLNMEWCAAMRAKIGKPLTKKQLRIAAVWINPTHDQQWMVSKWSSSGQATPAQKYVMRIMEKLAKYSKNR
jgi:hypothetical protein